MEIEAIQELIKVDEETRQKVQDIHEKKSQMKQVVEQEKKALSEKAWNDINSQVDQTKRELDAKIAACEKDIQAGYDADAAVMAEQYAQNREKWITELTDRVIGHRD